MFLGSGDEFRAEPEAARRRRSDDARQLRRRHLVPPPADDLAAQRWARTSSRRSPPASGRSPATSRPATRWASRFNGYDAVPARRVARPAGLARQAGRRLRRLRPAGRRRLHRPASSQSTEGNPRYYSGPLTGLPTATFKGWFTTYRPAGYLEALVQAGDAADAGAGRARRLLQRDRAGLGRPAPDRALQAGARDDAEGRRRPVLAAARVRRGGRRRRQPEPGPQPARSTTAWASSTRFGRARQRQRSRASTSASPTSRSTASAPTASRCWSTAARGASTASRSSAKLNPTGARVRLPRRTRCRAASATTTAPAGACSTSTRRTS